MKKDKIPKKELDELKNILILDKEYKFKRIVKIQSDNKQLFIRIPQKIVKIIDVKKGDKIEFEITLPHPQLKKEIIVKLNKLK